MSLERLQKSLIDMTQEEKLALLRDVREDRKVSKVAVTKRAAVKKNKTDKMAERFKQLTPEQQEALIKELKGET